MQIVVSKNTLLGLVLVLLSVLAVVNFIQIQSLKRTVEVLSVKPVSANTSSLAGVSASDHASHHGGGNSQSLCGAGDKSCGGEQMAQANLSPAEIEAAKKRMDTNGDGVCESCGMKVDDCISMGMLECGS